jgi:hypothetical protein
MPRHTTPRHAGRRRNTLPSTSSACRRCSFVYLAGCLLSAADPPLPSDACASVADTLVRLADDRVPNVRLAVARLLARLRCEGAPLVCGVGIAGGLCADALARLAADTDSDVRWHAVERGAPPCRIEPASEDASLEGLAGLRVH